MQVDFYHLTRQPVERVVPQLAERVVAGGGRLLIVSADPAQRALIDARLWDYAPASFLPHAEAGGAADAEQPVLIAGDSAAGNGARHILIADGQWRDAALGFDRAFHLFDDSVITAARAAWKALANAEGVERRYWKQGERGWEQAG
ncbi:DNA polymerase III subunit chi [Sphingomonas sp.]|uniref:DNA polymerase III subunit chi n=1 Tax=Sphingomonas sp. TaxID=28214 RepID=UPI001D72E7D7|nr:DNA polymerase III subunit chi [Sphingomonas sp.]MBX9796756.1 DNA polymerase III subunit chi [Sphingomonas sp.]